VTGALLLNTVSTTPVSTLGVTAPKVNRIAVGVSFYIWSSHHDAHSDRYR